MTNNGLNIGADGQARCWWCGDDPIYMAYHDQEWGRRQTDNIRLFEKLCLEGFQAGLSWITILRKREHFRAAFDGFDYHKIAAYTESDVQRLLQDAEIVRHERKIRSVINNAQKAIDLIEEYGSLYDFLKEFKPRNISSHEYGDVRARGTSPESERLSKELKKRGFSFVGPTTMYALMQAMGLVNDHVAGCFVRKDCEIC